jgi:3-oxoacyl-[acyl-carrier protein] reductase
MKFRNKVVLITGASRGIGRATAVLFAKEGAKVVVTYKTQKEKAESIVKLIGVNNSLLVQLDVTKEENVKKLVTKTINKFGKIDILVNNAGEILRPGDWKCDINTWQKTIDVNLTGVWLVTKAVIPVMQKQGYGSIVNLTSTVGLLGVAPVLAYSCAKNGVVALTKAFAKELAPQIRVNAIAPSNVMTDMTKSAGIELIKRMEQNTPLRRIAEPEEIARAILFLASEDASYITGEVLVVDGGYSLK